MTTKEKKRFWAKVLAFMLVASMMLSNLTVSTTFAATVDETAAAEESAEDADKTIETVPEEPKADAPETEEPEADTLKEEELKTDASKEDVSEEENSEDKKAEVEESEETSDEKNKEDEVHLEDNQEGNQENDANQEKVTEEEGKDAASEDDKAADLDENGIAIDDSKADEEEVLDEEELLEEVPAEVQAFLDAVAAIDVPEEDLTLEENAGLADSFRTAVFGAFELYEALSEEQRELEGVSAAYMELENMAAVLPDYEISIAAYGFTNVTVNPDFDPKQCYPGVSKHGGSVTKGVGEQGFYKRRAVNNFYCPNCGYFFGQSTAKEYANIQWKQSEADVISDVSFKVGNLDGYQCLQMDFTGAKAGTTLVTLQYDVNFHTRWNSSYAVCPSCEKGTSVQQYDDNWYHYEDTFYVTVTGEISFSGSEHWYYMPANAKDDEISYLTLRALTRDGSGYAVLDSRTGSVKLNDPNGVKGNYAEIEMYLDDWKGGATGGYTALCVDIAGLKATPGDKPIPIYIQYKVHAVDYWGYWDGYSYTTITDKINIVVYEPETITQGKETVTYNYLLAKKSGGYKSEKVVTSDDISKVAVSDSGDSFKVIGKTQTNTPVRVMSAYYKSNRQVKQFSNNSYYMLLSYVDCIDVRNFVITDKMPATTPVTIIKEFDGISEDQIPNNFVLNYSVSGCGQHNNVTGTLKKGDATLTNTDGTPRLSWNVDLPVAKHGSAVHTITFTESNAGVAGYKAPTMSGNTVKLEELTIEDGASKSVITVTNKYELKDNVFELFYDLNGGTNGPATQVYKGNESEMSHDFQVAGNEQTVKIPTNGSKVFKGWSEKLNGSVVYAYSSSTKAYSPEKVTVTRDSGKTSASKTLYAVWEEYTAAKPELTKLEKERLTTPPPGVTLPNGVVVNYDPTVVFLGDNPEPVTLLYKITVKGTAGAEYKVTDHGAKWVSGGGSYKYQDDDLIITGTIAEGETSAEIYVTKTFTKGNIEGGKLTNEANLESQDPDTTKGPDGEDGKGSGTADTEERHKVIINFITDDEKPETLADPSENDFKENEGFGFNVNGSQSQRAARSNRADTGTTVISIPSIITKDGKTYILDEIESETALAALKAASVNGVTSDIIQNLIYTLDMKGGSAPDKEEGGSDGIPDKYQAKIVYQAAEGGSQTGKNGYVTIKNNDRYSKDGTTSVSAEAIADEGGYFTNWTAEAAGHDGWSYTASDNALLSSSIPVKGVAVYTFTANFTQKAFLEIQITGSNATVAYNGGEQSVTGYTMTVRNENNEEISLPTGLTVTPEQADCAAKGTEVSETPYPMGLDSSKFTLGGSDAEKYSVTFQVTDGWLRITENDTLAVTAGDVSAVYDGNGHSVTPSANVEGARITVTYFDAEGNELPDAPKDAGSYTARIEAELEGYKTAVYEAAVTIHRRSLTVTTASAGKIYDGTPLTNSMAVVSVAGGAVAGEEITATATGSQTTVGRSTNTYRINWGNAKESNYAVTAALGTLTVTETTPSTPPTSPTPPTPPAPEGGGTGGGTGGGGGGTPDPTPAPTPAGLPAAQAIIPAAPPAAPAPAQPAEPEAEPVQEIEDEETPLASNETPEEPEAPAQNIEIEDEETPLAAPGAWALLNLILSILTVAVSVILLAGYFFGKKKGKEEEEKIQEYQDDEEQEELKRKGLVRILSILPAVVSVIFFILTEDMRNPMIFADRWTLWMLVFAVANGALLLLSKKTRKGDDDNKQKPGYEMA